MSQTNEELAEELKGLLGQTGLTTALGDESPQASATDEPEGNPLETDFFKAINAFRAARASDDPEKIAAAERQLQAVVRSELTGQDCTQA